MANDKDLVFNDGVTPITATGLSGALDIGPTVNPVTISLIVGAVTGTNPTLDITVQGLNASAAYEDVVKFPQLTAAHIGKNIVRKLHAKYKTYKLSYTIGGTSTPTFPLKAFVTVGGRGPDIG